MRIMVLFLAGSLVALTVTGTVHLARQCIVFTSPGDSFTEELNRRWRTAGEEHDRMLEAGVGVEERDAFLHRKGEEIKRWRHEQGHRYPGE